MFWNCSDLDGRRGAEACKMSVDESVVSKKSCVLRRREGTCFLKVVFRVDETSPCKDKFLKSSVSCRRDAYLYVFFKPFASRFS